MVKITQSKRKLVNNPLPNYAARNVTKGLTQGLSNFGRQVSNLGAELYESQEAKKKARLKDAERRFIDASSLQTHNITHNKKITEDDIKRFQDEALTKYDTDEIEHIKSKGLDQKAFLIQDEAEIRRNYNLAKDFNGKMIFNAKAKMHLVDNNGLGSLKEEIIKLRSDEVSFSDPEELKSSTLRDIREIETSHAKNMVKKGDFDPKIYESFSDTEKQYYLEQSNLNQTKALSAMVKMQESDPANFAIQDLGMEPITKIANPEPTVINRIVSHQEESGITPENIQALPNIQNTLLVRKIESINDPEERQKFLLELRSAYGDNYPYLLNGLSKDKNFDQRNKILMHLDPQLDHTTMSAMTDMFRVDLAEYQKVYKDRTGKGKEDIDEAIREELEDLFESDAVLTSIDNPSSMRDVISMSRSLAYFFLYKNNDIDTAISKSVDWINNKYEYKDVNDEKVRIPSAFSHHSKNIVKSLKHQLEWLKSTNIAAVPSNLPENVARNDYINMIKEQGRFVLNEQNESYLIHDGFSYVEDKEGNAIEFPISYLMTGLK